MNSSSFFAPAVRALLVAAAVAALPAHADNPHRSEAASHCANCGTVVSTRSYQKAAEHGSGLGVAGGALVGGLLGNHVGGGRGRTLATVAGAVGGGYAGNEIEKNARSSTVTEVRVRMSNGAIRRFTEAGPSHHHSGEQVRVTKSGLVAER